MADKTVRNIRNIADLSIPTIENDVDHLFFVDYEDIFPMSEYIKLQPVIAEITKLIVLHADDAAERIQREVTDNVARRLKEEVAGIVYGAKVPIVETVTVTDTKVEETVEPRYDW